MYRTGSLEPVAPSDLVLFVASAYRAFPDYAHHIEDMIVEGEKVVVRCTLTGTHKAEYMGIPPTGKKVQYGEIVVCRFAGGKIVESWVQEDELWMMQQLGVELRPQD